MPSGPVEAESSKESVAAYKTKNSGGKHSDQGSSKVAAFSRLFFHSVSIRRFPSILHSMALEVISLAYEEALAC